MIDEFPLFLTINFQLKILIIESIVGYIYSLTEKEKEGEREVQYVLTSR